MKCCGDMRSHDDTFGECTADVNRESMMIVPLFSSRA